MRTTVLGTPNLSDVSVMVAACYTELMRGGFVREAASLRGIELFTLEDALVASATLEQIKVDDEVVGGAIRHTLAMLRALDMRDEQRAAC